MVATITSIFSIKKIILIFCTRSRIHTGVVRTGINAISLQDFSKFFYFLTAQAVNDT